MLVVSLSRGGPAKAFFFHFPLGKHPRATALSKVDGPLQKSKVRTVFRAYPPGMTSMHKVRVACGFGGLAALQA